MNISEISVDKWADQLQQFPASIPMVSCLEFTADYVFFNLVSTGATAQQLKTSTIDKK